ncbi:MAG TPA: hypothetical protein VN285_12460 [Candidatus Deferrimicrobium sp.]|nr:hypothetical protein [Candidatus Deferrimicrobium sp.]
MPDLGIVLSLLVIGVGLLWLLIRSLRGQEVERRVIFVFILVAVAAPILFPVTFQEHATPVVKRLFDFIDSLPAGSVVLVSLDYDPAMAPEVQPMTNAMSRHCLTKGHKIVFMGLWATGQSILMSTLQDIILPDFPNIVEGKDFVNVGYKAGNEGVLNVIVTDFKKMFPTDVNGTPLDSTPIMADIRSCRDFDLILSIGGGRPGAKEWVLFVGDPGNVPIGVGVAAVTAPQMYPYYPQQLVGILGGVKGAAEYESELAHRYPRFAHTDQPGLRMMGPQTLAHVVIMAFIVIGNLAFFRGKKVRRT